MIDEIMEEHFRLFMQQGEPFSPHDLALATLDTACAKGLVDQHDDPGLDLVCMAMEERARYLMGL